ncbi:cyclic nucleotide-binding domain protein (macronuclear) [Tetrahymena thermophila SB210]|uniref:Cyclic nucleotide-binding domain protein n=1 Tax=Tetrahymena thermophila (strain SB210) TaxID=312017 RepID=Q22DA3_TETTS|nr:cyclic nucleotide-binding domain protein [Tetrahymena thermophila SB210]EAR83299.2 cyclic nucleotide-binding domain protein [Tetrahymena thermophila SB210]|eukprot:XP_001030962.2 cyclic nucleotide-binding domain protein [Tetrahymena thermophila SB210]
MPYKQEDTIYQLTKTNKNSTQRQRSVQEERYDNYIENDVESFVAYQDELGKTQESKVFSKYHRQDGNDNSHIYNDDASISPNISCVQSFKQSKKQKQSDQQDDKSVLSQTYNSNCNSNEMNEAIKIKFPSQKEHNKSDFIFSPNLPQADSPITLQQSNSINAASFRKCDDTELERDSAGFIGAWKKKPLIIITQVYFDFIFLGTATIQEQYITSIYWAVITMITLGYGDYVPKTSYERVFVIFITLISCGVFAYSINQIGTIVTNITKKKSQFQQKMAQISGYLNERGIKNNMIMKIKENFAYLQRETEKDMEVHNIIQTQLCKSLRKEVFREMYIQILKGCKAFNLNYSEQFLLNLAPLLKEKKFSPEEIIYEQDNPNLNLYFIVKGEVQLFLDMGGKKRQIKILSKNDVFGEQPFFSQATSNHSASSVNVVKVVYVNLQDFLSVIKSYQKDFETYCMMKDKLNLYSTSKRLGLKCYSCGQFQHLIKDCPFVNYIPNKDKILINYKAETIQERNSQNQEFRKKIMKHDKATQIQKQIQEEIVNFLIEKNLYENLNELLQILKNQEIVFDQKNEDKEQKTQSSHKSLQVLYPKMNNEFGTENIIQENNSPNKPHISPTIQGSQYVIQQQQQRKIKRTQTSQIGRSDSLAFLGASSSKLLSDYIRYPTLEKGESRKSNKHTSFLNSQMLRESSRKIILEEIKESQKLIQLSVQSNQNSQNTNSNISNSILNNQSLQSPYNSNIQYNQQSQQLTFTQQSQNNSIYAYGPNSNSISVNNSQSYNQIQFQPQLDQINKNVQNDSKQKNDSQSIKNYKKISSITSLSQKNKQQNSFQNEKIKQKEKKEDQMLKAVNQLSQISNPFNVQSLLYNQAIQLTQWSSLELNNFEKMNIYQVFFPHNNYSITIENYNYYIKKYKFLQRMNSSVIKKEKIKQLRLSIFLSKGNQKLLTQNSQKTRTKSKSQYYSKNN